MLINEWKIYKNFTTTYIARLMGVTKGAAHGSMFYGAIPKPKVIKRVALVSCGSVDANSIYGINIQNYHKAYFMNRKLLENYSDLNSLLLDDIITKIEKGIYV